MASAETKIGDGRRERTRRALLTAGEKLLAENYAVVSIDDLVAEAAVAKGTFYNHFNDKTDLFHAVIAEVRDDMRGTILHAVRGVEDPARKVARGFCIAVRYLMQQPLRRQFILASQQGLARHLNESGEGLVSFMAEGIATGRFRISTAEAGVLLNFGIVQICATLDFNQSDAFATIARVQQLGAALLRGVGIAHDEAEMIAAQEADGVIRPALAPGD